MVLRGRLGDRSCAITEDNVAKELFHVTSHLAVVADQDAGCPQWQVFVPLNADLVKRFTRGALAIEDCMKEVKEGSAFIVAYAIAALSHNIFDQVPNIIYTRAVSTVSCG